MKYSKQDYLRTATDIYVDGDVKLDVSADMLPCLFGSGAWVRAWMYVSDDETEARVPETVSTGKAVDALTALYNALRELQADYKAPDKIKAMAECLNKVEAISAELEGIRQALADRQEADALSRE